MTLNPHAMMKLCDEISRLGFPKEAADMGPEELALECVRLDREREAIEAIED